MTEEIIIDGVNVAGCNFRLEREEKQKCECCHATGFGVICDCENWHNCYYKQLKRLEQENAQLKNERTADLTKQLKRLQAENEELKQEYKQAHEDFICSDTALRIANTELDELKQENEQLKALCDTYFTCYRAKHNDIEGNLFSYRKALEEIRDNCVEMLATIAEEGKPNKSIVDTIWCKNIPCCTLFELIENTQSKINEVLK